MDSDLDLNVIVYMGGCCGDLVTALIDHTDVDLDVTARAVTLPKQRQRLKKPHLFTDDLGKDQYLKDIASVYHSVPSHDLDYHVRRGHKFIGISVNDPDTALWAAQRFKQIHRDQVWQSIKQHCAINTVDQYAQLMLNYSNMISGVAHTVIDLENIRCGQVLDVIERITGVRPGPITLEFYRTWLHMQKDTHRC